jgi:hypothetical protein
VPGVLLTLVFWFVGALIFAYYLATFANYTATYAGLASVMIALIFLYMIGVIFIIGAEINAALMKFRVRAIFNHNFLSGQGAEGVKARQDGGCRPLTGPCRAVPQACVPLALGELAAVAADNQAVMMIHRCRQIEESLQQPVYRGCVEEVEPAHDMRNCLQRIIDDDGEVIARRRIGSRQDHIPPCAGIGGDFAFLSVARLRPGQCANERQRLFHVEPPGMLQPGGQQVLPVGPGTLAVVRRIERRTVRVARPSCAGVLRG